MCTGKKGFFGSPYWVQIKEHNLFYNGEIDENKKIGDLTTHMDVSKTALKMMVR